MKALHKCSKLGNQSRFPPHIARRTSALLQYYRQIAAARIKSVDTDITTLSGISIDVSPLQSSRAVADVRYAVRDRN
jgi:hypothetical protein